MADNVEISASKTVVRAAAGKTFQEPEKVHFIYPRDLTIYWGDDNRYWKWFWLLIESQDMKVVEAAKLIKVCWFEICGKYDTSKLTPGVSYKVSFNVMMKNPNDAWKDFPMTLELIKPDGSVHYPEPLYMNTIPQDVWYKVELGVFKASGSGEIKFSMKETENYWKTGLIIQSVIVAPTYDAK